MECVAGGKGEPLRPDDEAMFPYCAAQRNLDNVGIRAGRSVPGLGWNPAGTGLRGGGRRKQRERCGTLKGECRGCLRIR